MLNQFDIICIGVAAFNIFWDPMMAAVVVVSSDNKDYPTLVRLVYDCFMVLVWLGVTNNKDLRNSKVKHRLHLITAMLVHVTGHIK